MVGFSLNFLNTMKRIGTAFLIFFSFIAVSAQGQIAHITMHPSVKLNSAFTMGTNLQGTSPILPSSGSEQPLATKIDTVLYYGDTSAGLWVDVPLLDRATGDSLGYYNVSQDGLFYYQNEDTIGPLDYMDQNGGTHTVNDTMYSRVMGVRFTTPTDISSPKLVGADLTIFPISFNPTDYITFWVLPIMDSKTGYPFPNVIGTQLAAVKVPSSKITVGQLNTVHVTFSKSLGSGTKLTYPQFAIVAFVDGPNFSNDTVGYVLDQNLQGWVDTRTQTLTIDTDGSAGTTGEPMRSYQQNLDDGTVLGSYIGGGGAFLVNFEQLDPTSGVTGQAYDGNLLLTAYFSGTSSAVDPNAQNVNALSGNYPDPVSTTTEINYNLAQSGPVTLNVYNALGQNVGTLVNSVQGAGEHTATFNSGTLPDGMYYYKLQSGEFTATQPMVVAR